jgi:hypothetical protein
VDASSTRPRALVRIDALVALAMALSLALLKATTPIDIDALIG